MHFVVLYISLRMPSGAFSPRRLFVRYDRASPAAASPGARLATCSAGASCPGADILMGDNSEVLQRLDRAKPDLLVRRPPCLPPDAQPRAAVT